MIRKQAYEVRDEVTSVLVTSYDILLVMYRIAFQYVSL